MFTLGMLIDAIKEYRSAIVKDPLGNIIYSDTVEDEHRIDEISDKDKSRKVMSISVGPNLMTILIK